MPRADNHFGLSYERCAEILGISPVRVRQIEQCALVKLRKAFERAGVMSFDQGKNTDDAKRADTGSGGPICGETLLACSKVLRQPRAHLEK